MQLSTAERGGWVVFRLSHTGLAKDRVQVYAKATRDWTLDEDESHGHGTED